MKTNKKVRVNLGCGVDYREGWTNTDFDSNTKADKHFDMTKDTFPFENDYVDYLYNRMVFEHIRNPSYVLSEIFRILKPGGKAKIITMHFSSAHALIGDIHLRTFISLYWLYFRNLPKAMSEISKIFEKMVKNPKSKFTRLYWQHFSQENHYRDWEYIGNFQFSKLSYKIVFPKGKQIWNHFNQWLVNKSRKIQRLYEETMWCRIFPADEVEIIYEK